jgi:YD repeat-containing protein
VIDREESGLRSQVKTCRTERNFVYPEQDWVMHTEDTFSPQGHLLERRHRNPGATPWSIVCRYDDQGHLLEKAVQDERFSYVYDALGRLERVLLGSAQASERVFESVRYAADGSKTNTSYPTPLDETQRQNISVDVQGALHFSIDAVAILTVFDDHDRAIRKALFDRDDRVIRRIAFRYDDRGLLMEEGELLNRTIRDDFRNVYRYDDRGRRIETTWRLGDLHVERRVFEHNEQGDVTLEKVEQESGLVLLPDSGPQSWAQRFVYRYDDRENWVERST